MNDLLAPPVPPPALPLSGKRLYSPGTLATFTSLCSLPIGFILYGLNVKARGNRSLGVSIVSFGALLQVFFLFLGAADAFPRGALLVFGLFGALNVYRFESRPYALALSQGAVKARWWPPALVVLVISLVFLVASIARESQF